MKIGILACGFNCSEYFDQVLEPWLQYKEKHGDLIISAVYGQFKENAALAWDDSPILMRAAFDKRQIDYLAFSQGDEAFVRNAALGSLIREKCDVVWLLDFDEIYTLEQIEKIVKFVENNPFTTWFKINFKNYVFDKTHYVNDFCPPRIFRTEFSDHYLDGFYFDNDLNYEWERKKYSYKDFSSMQIPAAVAFVNHFSWCGSSEYLKNKIDYQLKHFNGICSYKWDDEKNQLALDMDFYKKYNVPVPIIHEDE